jgi:hypothetical protein
VGVSLPHKFLEQIDKEREDIPRSRYLLRILERSYEKRIVSLEDGFGGLASSEPNEGR